MESRISTYNKKEYTFATSAKLETSCNNLFKGNHWFNISLIILSATYLLIFGYSGLIFGLNVFSFSFFLYRFILTLIGLQGDSDSDVKVEYLSIVSYCQ